MTPKKMLPSDWVKQLGDHVLVHTYLYIQNGVRKSKSWWWSPFSTPNYILHRPLGSVPLRRTQLVLKNFYRKTIIVV